MFKKLTNASVALVQKYLPDAFIFAILLTILTFILSFITTGQSIMELIQHWGTGVWSLLLFTMQMVLVLVLGTALANAPAVKTLLKSISKVAKTPGQAIMLVSFVSAVACWLNWGFGLIVGALLAKELAKNVKGVDYRLLIAAAYSGFVVWHGGISGSIPLTIATDAAGLAVISEGTINEVIPVSKTIFSPLNLIVSWVIILTLPFLNRAMHPDRDNVIEIDPSLLADDEEEAIAKEEIETPAQKLENSKFLSCFIIVVAVVFLVKHFIEKGFSLDLNIVNLIFLTLGLYYHKTPIRYVRAIEEAVKGAGGIVLQFPFYAGIMGLMTGANADGVSLASVITNLFLRISNETTFPLFTFWSAGLVNIFVPSGGGQWAVQGPVMMPAAIPLGVDPAKAAMAIAWGDAWTNMIQPFWALPALGLAGLSAKDIMGYCLIVLLYTGVIISLGFLLL
ncbi:short-chain fatty acid transporter [Tepidimicrobium xylanilyticum]|uniref:short-chain fatty acid transporter n=1 Tax=Tepidimicrobium xylanilyticum TaxID=1123352 RepID=UPI002650ED72|nr:short-chain fatty acid transporter [Tepidimicrobium xylanilyticum]GMG95542.1 short-chain fatty acids transporter [Tepidimicrobium xylanilyticum]